MTIPTEVAAVLAEMRDRKVNHGKHTSPTLIDWAGRIESALTKAEAVPVATVCFRGDRYASGNMIEVQLQIVPGTELPIGMKLYAHAPPVVSGRKPLSKTMYRGSAHPEGCSEHLLDRRCLAADNVPTESLGRDAEPDEVAAGQQEETDLLDELARIYATIPKLPVTAETAEEATNALLAFCYLPAVRKALDLQILPPAPLGDAEDYLRPLRNAIGTADAYATGGPRNLRIVTLRMDEAEAMLARASLATPQPPKPAGAVPEDS